MGSLRYTWPVFYAVLLAYRCLFSFVAFPVVTAFTTLGDARRYSGRATLAFDRGALWESTAMTDTLGFIFQKLAFGFPVGVGLWFQLLAFVGIVRFLSVVDAKQRILLYLLFLFPSFTLWSSVPSKEAVVVFALGFVGARIVEFMRGNFRVGLIDVLSLYLIGVFKPQYLAALLILVTAVFVGRFVKQKSAAMLAICLIPVPLLYVLKDKISALAFEVQRHFLNTGRSTREAFFVDDYDVFTRMVEGFYRSLVGPTWGEATLSVLHRASYFEGLALVAVLGFIFLRNISLAPVFTLFVSVSSFFWILFATFPFGVMNPGSAIRYRTGYFILLILVVVVVASIGRFDVERRKRRATPSRTTISVT